jgi:hypothetical protein
VYFKGQRVPLVLEYSKDKILVSVLGESPSLFTIDRNTNQHILVQSDFECISMCTLPSFVAKRIPIILVRDRGKVYVADLKEHRLTQLFKINYLDGSSQ